VLIDPSVAKEIVKPTEFMPDEEAFSWFGCVLPRLIEAGVPRIELIQEPGQTIFVPGGWWHAVLNVTETTAVTQNFASRANFPAVWADVSEQRPGLASQWLAALDHAALQEAELRPLVSLATRHMRILASDESPPPPVEAEAAAAVTKALGGPVGEDSDESEEEGPEGEGQGGSLTKEAIVAIGRFLQQRKEARVRAKDYARVQRETRLERLVAAGVAEEEAHAALIACGWDLEEAVEYINSPDDY